MTERAGFGAAGRMTGVAALWRGDVPLSRAFWTWFVFIGLPLNLATSVLFLALVAMDRPIAGLVAGHVMTVPYNILVAVGVWRAAGRPGVPPGLRRLARAVTLAGAVVFSVT